MIVTLHEQRRRGRRRFWWSLAKAILLLAVIGGAFVAGHRLGREAGGRDVIGLRQEVAVLNATVDDLQAQLASAQQESEDSAAVSPALEAGPQEGGALIDGLLDRIAELEDALAQGAAVPAPAAEPLPAELRELMDLLRARLDEGVAPARLRTVVEGVQRERQCAETADTRRFVVQTPARSDAANGSVTFPAGITVTAEGDVPADGEGAAALRYDPALPVTVRFVPPDGAPSEVSGVLPLEHSLVLGEEEHLFTAEAGAPGMLRITERVCAWP